MHVQTVQGEPQCPVKELEVLLHRRPLQNSGLDTTSRNLACSCIPGRLLASGAAAGPACSTDHCCKELHVHLICRTTEGRTLRKSNEMDHTRNTLGSHTRIRHKHHSQAASAALRCAAARFFSSASAARLLLRRPRAWLMKSEASNRRSMSTPCCTPLQTKEGRHMRSGAWHSWIQQEGEGAVASKHCSLCNGTSCRTPG